MIKINAITTGMALAGSVAAVSYLPVSAYAMDQTLTLEEIIVTARKREESIQDVPVSVTAISAQLENAAVKNIQDMQNYVPNVNIDFGPASAGGATISIRGLSQQDPDKSVESPVGLILDGVPMGTTAGQMLDNFDLQRVEVLRGPQGTLFGKNTTGGALNVTRTLPTRELGAKVKIGAGEWGAREAKAVVNLPLTESGGVKLFAAKSESDGFIKNTTTGKDAGGIDYQQVGLAVAFDVTENLNVLLSFDRINDDSERGAMANFNTFDNLVCLASVGGFSVPGFTLPAAPGAAFGAGCMDLDPGSDEDHVSTNAHNDSATDNDFASLSVNWELGDWQLTSITGYQDRDEKYFHEWDASSVRFLELTGGHNYRQFSQEVRINGDITERVSLTAGLYYFESDYRQYQTSYDMWYYLGFGPGFMPGLDLPLGDVSSTLDGKGTNETSAVFASMDWMLTDKLTLNLGARYTWEEKTLQAADASYDSQILGTLLPEGEKQNYKDDWREFSPRVALQYDYSEDVMWFTSYAEGFKSGGFFARGADADAINSFDPEYVKTVELGVKSEWWDNRVRVNATVFQSDYTDKQEDVLYQAEGGQVNTLVANAGDAKIQGFELEMQALISEGLQMYLMAGYIDAKYEKFFADIDGEAFPGEGSIPTDNTHLSFRNAPQTTFGLGFDYTLPLSFGEFSTNYSYRWSDEYETEFHNDPLGRVDSMGMHNLSLNLSFNQNYRISLYGRNLTDERYARLVKIATLSQMGMYNAPRSYGIEFVAEF